MTEVIIIGAGIGGLATAITAASRGCTVNVYERASRAGGKAGVTTIDGVEVDTGPSVVTLPEVFDKLFRAAGSQLTDEVTLRTEEPAFRYLYPDGAVLDMHHDIEATLDSIRGTLGDKAAEQMSAFLHYAQDIWRAGAPNFVYGKAPSLGTVMRLGLTKLGDVRRIDSMRSMYRGICSYVTDPHLRMLLARYATYNGSNVLTAPATLNCIAHVELALGGFGIQGGIGALIDALVAAAERIGVRFHFGNPIEKILVENGRVAGIETGDGSMIRAPVVVANADVGHVAQHLLPAGQRRTLTPPTPPSMSGWTGIVRAKKGLAPRPGHAVLFAEPYLDEFTDIFDRDRPPQTPTVYMCAQQTCHGRAGWPEHEPLFIMATAPAEPAKGAREPQIFKRLQNEVLSRLRTTQLIRSDDELVWARTPSELAKAFPGSRGSIYGAASNSAMAAFKRPPNRIKSLPGLYLASGSAHPGGGLPLCALSGMAAAEALVADLGPNTLRTAS
ncbi:MAG: phytoene desaturase family protein [Myxococcota bacterium]